MIGVPYFERLVSHRRKTLLAFVCLALSCGGTSGVVVGQDGREHHEIDIRTDKRTGQTERSVVARVHGGGSSHHRVLLTLRQDEAEPEDPVRLTFRREGELWTFRECHTIHLVADDAAQNPASKHEGDFLEDGRIWEEVSWQTGCSFLQQLGDANDSRLHVCRTNFTLSQTIKNTLQAFCQRTPQSPR